MIMKLESCRCRAACCAWLLLMAGASSAVGQTPAEVRESRRLASAAGSAYRAGDLVAADTLFERALALRPGHTLLLYSLAAVRAGHGGRAPAAQLLLRDAAQR
ncbi:MAG TPA: hypothetical protein VK939_02600, partial [Longimicrobiales bacterium]|nr:hypothetical protein [Longimicrobiales bacterium]